MLKSCLRSRGSELPHLTPARFLLRNEVNPTRRMCHVIYPRCTPVWSSDDCVPTRQPAHVGGGYRRAGISASPSPLASVMTYGFSNASASFGSNGTYDIMGSFEIDPALPLSQTGPASVTLTTATGNPLFAATYASPSAIANHLLQLLIPNTNCNPFCLTIDFDLVTPLPPPPPSHLSQVIIQLADDVTASITSSSLPAMPSQSRSLPVSPSWAGLSVSSFSGSGQNLHDRPSTAGLATPAFDGA